MVISVFVAKLGGGSVSSRISGVLAVVLFTLLALGCGDDGDGTAPVLPSDEAASAGADDPPQSSSTSSSTSSTTSTTAEPTTASTDEESEAAAIPEPSDGVVFEEYIVSQIEGFYEVRDRAFQQPTETPEIDFPELANFAVDPQLQVMQDAIRTKAMKGLANKEPDEPAVGPTVDEEHRTSGIITNEGDLVTVFDCEVNDDALYYPETGELDNDNVVTILIVVTLERFETDWKITTTKVSQRIRGVAGCFLAADSEFPY